MRILIADDDVFQLKWLEDELLCRGHSVTTTENGVEALAVYKLHAPFDAVITDWQMPLLDGVELIREIRRICPHQHVVLQTTEKEKLVPGVKQLLKPFGFQQLLRALRLPVQALLF